MYKSYIEPFFIQNEANLDAAIVSAQTNVLTFLQSRFAALWDILWSIVNKTPANAQATGPNGSPGAPVSSPMDTAKQLFSAYAPGMLGAFARPPVQPHPSATSSTSSFQAPAAGNVYQRSPAVTPGYEAHPPFPEPQIHQ